MHFFTGFNLCFFLYGLLVSGDLNGLLLGTKFCFIAALGALTVLPLVGFLCNHNLTAAFLSLAVLVSNDCPLGIFAVLVCIQFAVTLATDFALSLVSTSSLAALMGCQSAVFRVTDRAN